MLSRSFASTVVLASSLSVFWACDESSSTDAAANADATSSGNADATPRPDATADGGVPADGGNEDATVNADAEPAETGPADAGEADAAEMDGGAPVPVPHTVVLSPTGHDRLYGATFDSLGNMYAVGVASSGTVAPDFEMIVAKLTPAGELDPTFGNNGVARNNVAIGGGAGELARGIVLQADGRIVISGTIEHAGATDARDRDVALVRFEADGDVDMSFGTAGVVTLDLSDGEVVGNNYVADATWGLAQYANGDLLVYGSQKAAGRTDTDLSLVRLTSEGANIDTFGTDGVFTLDINNQSANARSVTILPDGSAVAAGYMTDNGVVTPIVFKVDGDGELDPNFGVNGVFNEAVLLLVTEAYAALPQGTSFVTAGYGRNDSSENIDWTSLRLTNNGELDTTWGTNGYRRFDFAGFNDNARTLAVLPDNRVLLAGGARTTMDNIDNALALLTVDGALDTTFNGTGQQTYELGGVSDFFWGVAISPDQRTIGLVGIKGVAASSGLNDDAVVYFMPMPQ